ncbi:MAG: dTMP kinase, partial [Deltaproteobacteria bacterium]|nr:dTMP kinase [Deltaproteobacteria bacterium]
MSKETNAKDFPSLMQRNGLLKMSSAGGCLIAFEGIDGAGKTTQAKLLYDYLKDQGHNVLLTWEPTDGPYGQKIRELFVSRQKVTPQEELDLFINDRRQHVEEVIKPALHEGRIV